MFYFTEGRHIVDLFQISFWAYLRMYVYFSSYAITWLEMWTFKTSANRSKPNRAYLCLPLRLFYVIRSVGVYNIYVITFISLKIVWLLLHIFVCFRMQFPIICIGTYGYVSNIVWTYHVRKKIIHTISDNRDVRFIGTKISRGGPIKRIPLY